MNTRYIKVCLRPGCPNTYLEESKCFEDDVCECGAPLILKEEVVHKVVNVFGNPDTCDDTEIKENNEINENNQETKLEPIFVCDPSGGIHFNLKKEEELLSEDRVVIYIGGRIYKEIPIEYDETIFGRTTTTHKPDVDLSEIDMSRKTSRNHLLIYRQNGKYIARNMTAKNSVHVERTVLKEGEECELKDNNLIILSRSIVMVFRKGNE